MFIGAGVPLVLTPLGVICRCRDDLSPAREPKHDIQLLTELRRNRTYAGIL